MWYRKENEDVVFTSFFCQLSGGTGYSRCHLGTGKDGIDTKQTILNKMVSLCVKRELTFFPLAALIWFVAAEMVPPPPVLRLPPILTDEGRERERERTEPKAYIQYMAVVYARTIIIKDNQYKGTVESTGSSNSYHKLPKCLFQTQLLYQYRKQFSQHCCKDLP